LTTIQDARRSAERAASDSYGRLVASLAARTRDVAAAEDALAILHEEAAGLEPGATPDKRLNLMFVCAHPAIDTNRRNE